MDRPRIATLGIALSLACIATAASATVVYRDVYVSPAPVQVVRVERVMAPEVIAYDSGYVTYTAPDSPRVVERYVMPRETIVVQAAPLTEPRAPRSANEWNPRHPHWGHLIGYGLFNTYRGANDFGQ